MTDLRDRKAALPTEEIVASDFLTREARPRRTSLALTPAALAPMVRNYVEIVDKGVPSTQGKNRTIRQLIDDLREQASPEQIAAAFKGVAQAQAGWLAQGGGVFEHLLPQMLEATPAPIKDYHLVAMACGLAWGLGQAGSARDTATLEDIRQAPRAWQDGKAANEIGSQAWLKKRLNLVALGVKMAADPLAALTDTVAIRAHDALPLIEMAYQFTPHAETFVLDQLEKLSKTQLPLAHKDRLISLLLRPAPDACPPKRLRAALALYVHAGQQAPAAAMGCFYRTYLQALALDQLIVSPLDRGACEDRMDDLRSHRRAVQAELSALKAAAPSPRSESRDAAIAVLDQLATKLANMYAAFHAALHRGTDWILDQHLDAWRGACEPDGPATMGI